MIVTTWWSPKVLSPVAQPISTTARGVHFSIVHIFSWYDSLNRTSPFGSSSFRCKNNHPVWSLPNITTIITQVPLLMTFTSSPKVDSTFHMHPQTPGYPMLEGKLHGKSWHGNCRVVVDCNKLSTLFEREA